jgi:superfamily I DNA/RNA helicase
LRQGSYVFAKNLAKSEQVGWDTASGHVSIGTVHLAKGLEFRAVAVMACDDEVIPLQGRIEAIGRCRTARSLRHRAQSAPRCMHLARDHLLVAGVSLASKFPDDFTEAGRVQGARMSARSPIVLSSRSPRHEVAASFFG